MEWGWIRRLCTTKRFIAAKVNTDATLLPMMAEIARDMVMLESGTFVIRIGFILKCPDIVSEQKCHCNNREQYV